MSTYNVKDQKSLAELEAVLAQTMFIGGNTPNAQDALTFEAFENNAPDAAQYPGIAGWFYLVHYFAAVREQWKKEEPKKEEKKVEKKAEKKEEDLDDMFGDDAQEDSEAEKAREARKKAAMDKKKQKDGKAKPAVVQKSIILLDIKVWEEDTDFDKLAKTIQEMKMDGLDWKLEYKTPTIAFGMKKLVMGLVVEDDKVSVDDVIEKITAMEDIVQSVDIASFNKI